MGEKLILVGEPWEQAVRHLPTYVFDHRDNRFRATLVRHPLLEARVVLHAEDGTNAASPDTTR